MNEKIKIPISFELANYTNRLMFEENNLTFIMCRLFEKHKDDENSDFLYSELFKKYHRELELIHYEYSLLRIALNTKVIEYLKNAGINDVSPYSWSITDFNERCIDVERLV
jgi:hypothetical protein